MELRAPGRHNVANALAAIAAATAAGAGLACSARAASRAFRPVAGRLQTQGGPRRRDGHRRHLQRESRFGAGGDRRARARRAGRAGWCSATWAKSAIRARPSIAKSASTRAPRASIGLLTTGALTAHAVAAFGPGARALSRRSTRSSMRCGASLHGGRPTATTCSSRARASCAWSASSKRSTGAADGRRPLMLLALANWIASDVRTFNVFSYITLRAVLATMTALVISFVVGPADDPQAHRIQDRTGGARRRSADASDQGRNADHGRRADPRLDRDHDAALGRPCATASSGSCCS